MPQPKKQPKLVSYGSALYAKMLEDAELVDGTPIWQGRLIQTCLSVGIPEGYYKKVVDALRTMGSLEIVSRGSRGNTLTIIALGVVPTQDLYQQTIVKKGWEGLTSTPSLDTLSRQVTDLAEQIGGLHIPLALKNLEDRLEAVETAVKDLQEQLQHDGQLIAMLIGEQRR